MGQASFSDFSFDSGEKGDEVRVQSVIVHLFLFTPVRLCEEISYAVALLKIKYLIMLLNVSFHVMKDKYNMMSLIKQQCLYILKLKNIQNTLVFIIWP